MKYFLSLAFTGFLGSLSLIAGDDHNHEAAIEAAPHGGILRNAGDIKAELVLKGDLVKVYFYDKKLKLITIAAETLSGEIGFPKKEKKPVSLKKKENMFEGTIEGISKVHRFDLHFKIKHGGKDTVIDFGIDNV